VTALLPIHPAQLERWRRPRPEPVASTEKRAVAGREFDLATTSMYDGVQPFGASTPVVQGNSPARDTDPWLSPDQRALVFSSNRAGTLDIYVATR